MRRTRRIGVALVMAIAVAAIAVAVVLARGPDGIRGGSGGPLQVLSDLSGVAVDDIRAARLEGQSLLDIAAANGVGAEDLTAAVVAARSAAIDALVEAGTISAEQAARLQARTVERVEAMLARIDTGPGHNRAGRGGGHRGDGACARIGAAPIGPQA